MQEACRAKWKEISKKCSGALVYFDNQCAEALHWSGAFDYYLDSNVKHIRELSPLEVIDGDAQKAVFCLSSAVLDDEVACLQSLIEGSGLQYVIIITAAPVTLHHFLKGGTGEELNEEPFQQLEEKVLEWMGNMSYTAEVLNEPLIAITSIIDSVFLSSRFNFNPREQPIRGAEQLLNTMKISCKTLAYELDTCLSFLGVREEIFATGMMAKMVARELADLPTAKSRRKNQTTTCTTLLIDRSSDWSTVLSGASDSALDKIVSSLPRLSAHRVDRRVDLSQFSSARRGEVLSGCLAPYSESESLIPLLVSSKSKDALMSLSRLLLDACITNRLKVSPASLKSTAKQIDACITALRGSPDAFDRSLHLIQITLAVQELSRTAAELDNLTAVCRGLLQTCYESGHTGAIKEILFLAEKQLEKPYADRTISVDGILTAMCFTMTVKTSLSDDGWIQSLDLATELLVRLTVNAVEAGSTPEFLKSRDGDLAKDDTTIRNKLNSIINGLKAVVISNNHCAQHTIGSSIEELEPGMPVTLSPPLPVRLVRHLLTPGSTDLPQEDLAHVSTGLSHMLKAGFGMFMGKTKPASSKLWLIFVVGGITFSEVKTIETIAASHNTKVLIGSTDIITASGVIQNLCG